MIYRGKPCESIRAIHKHKLYYDYRKLRYYRNWLVWEIKFFLQLTHISMVKSLEKLDLIRHNPIFARSKIHRFLLRSKIHRLHIISQPILYTPNTYHYKFCFSNSNSTSEKWDSRLHRATQISATLHIPFSFWCKFVRSCKDPVIKNHRAYKNTTVNLCLFHEFLFKQFKALVNR